MYACLPYIFYLNLYNNFAASHTYSVYQFITFSSFVLIYFLYENIK
jgi:hypothetical protein